LKVIKAIIIIISLEAPGSKALPQWTMKGMASNAYTCIQIKDTEHQTHFCFCFESTQLACWVQSQRAQVEAQYWGNPKVARLEGTPAILFWSRHSYTQIYIQTRNRTQQTSVKAIWLWIFIFHSLCEACGLLF